ncbi:hypothetical protein CWI38_0570p0040 [Hamiltosporidium tvaerminnensis]|uniref:Uncharacterized protein n=1 Tax=Hamiltosporidium tvaerminnensis TaxID=1176355 RepID=A0A4Q9LXB3_9MICR|nr:hypothetical protein CWI38_0570p0040 [Hamiltosporidium tvaerminnensis]
MEKNSDEILEEQLEFVFKDFPPLTNENIVKGFLNRRVGIGFVMKDTKFDKNFVKNTKSIKNEVKNEEDSKEELAKDSFVKSKKKHVL